MPTRQNPDISCCFSSMNESLSSPAVNRGVLIVQIAITFWKSPLHIATHSVSGIMSIPRQSHNPHRYRGFVKFWHEYCIINLRDHRTHGIRSITARQPALLIRFRPEAVQTGVDTRGATGDLGGRLGSLSRRPTQVKAGETCGLRMEGFLANPGGTSGDSTRGVRPNMRIFSG